MRDRPRSPRRAVDVAAHALLAHLTASGAAGRAPEAQAWRTLHVLGVVLALFVAIAIGMWSQVNVAWTWNAPTAPETRIALTLMSAALVGLCATAVPAATIVSWWTVRDRRRSIRRLGPLLIVIACAATLVIGCLHVASQWPGAGVRGWPAGVDDHRPDPRAHRDRLPARPPVR